MFITFFVDIHVSISSNVFIDLASFGFVVEEAVVEAAVVEEAVVEAAVVEEAVVEAAVVVAGVVEEAVGHWVISTSVNFA
jgi:hypothetical protein